MVFPLCGYLDGFYNPSPGRIWNLPLHMGSLVTNLLVWWRKVKVMSEQNVLLLPLCWSLCTRKLWEWMDGCSVPLLPQEPPDRQLTCSPQVRVTSQPSGYGSRASVFQEGNISLSNSGEPEARDSVETGKNFNTLVLLQWKGWLPAQSR